MAHRHLVIDADIICSAGLIQVGDTRSAVAARFLIAVRDCGHSVVITDALLQEWSRRRSRFSSTWMVSMFAKKQVRRVMPEPLDLRAAVAKGGLSTNEARSVQKDQHLLEAAMASDRRIASLDEVARVLFGRIAKLSTGRSIRAIHWLNPERSADEVLAWLARGGPDEPALTLGATAT